MWPELFFAAGIYGLVAAAALAASLFGCSGLVTVILVVLYYNVRVPRSDWFGRLGIWRWFREVWFPVTVEGFVKPPPPGQVYVYAVAPHGLFAWGSIFGVLLDPDHFGHIECSTTSLMFALPLVRNMAQTLGAFPATRDQLSRRIERGQSVLLNPEGMKAFVHMSRGRKGMLDVLKKRRGFCELVANVRNARSVSVVPVYCPGEWDTYHTWFPWPGVQEWLISRIWYAGPFLMLGWMGTCLPRRVRLHLTFGQPIPLAKGGDNGDGGGGGVRTGEELHQAYMDAITFMSESATAAAAE